MQTDIQSRSFSLTNALKEYAKQKLESSLSSCEDHLQQVVVRLSDINGPKGGKDKLCHIQVVLAGMPDVVIDDTEEDMYAAIDRATERAGLTVVRKVDRQQTLQRQDRQKLSHASL